MMTIMDEINTLDALLLTAYHSDLDKDDLRAMVDSAFVIAEDIQGRLYDLVCKNPVSVQCLLNLNVEYKRREITP